MQKGYRDSGSYYDLNALPLLYLAAEMIGNVISSLIGGKMRAGLTAPRGVSRAEFGATLSAHTHPSTKDQSSLCICPPLRIPADGVPEEDVCAVGAARTC